MTNFEKTVTLDFFAETLGDLVEDYLHDCADCPFNNFCESLPYDEATGLSCANIIKKWAKAEVAILDDIEREYLKTVLAPWLNKYKVRITKYNTYNKNNTKEWLEVDIYFKDGIGGFTFPGFPAKTMYVGMENGKEYTPKELGLR